MWTGWALVFASFAFVMVAFCFDNVTNADMLLVLVPPCGVHHSPAAGDFVRVSSNVEPSHASTGHERRHAVDWMYVLCFCLILNSACKVLGGQTV